MHVFSFVFVVLCTSAMASCGQTGDLFLPEDDPKQKSKDQSQS